MNSQVRSLNQLLIGFLPFPVRHPACFKSTCSAHYCETTLTEGGAAIGQLLWSVRQMSGAARERERKHRVGTKEREKDDK